MEDEPQNLEGDTPTPVFFELRARGFVEPAQAEEARTAMFALIETLGAIASKGQISFSLSLSGEIEGREQAQQLRNYRITPREQEVIELAAQGFTYKKIAEAVGLTEQSIKNHMQNIMRKTNSRSRYEALSKALPLSSPSIQNSP